MIGESPPPAGIIDGVSEGLCVVSLDYDILWANSVCKSWVCPDEPMVGKNFFDYFTYHEGTCIDPGVKGEEPSNTIGRGSFYSRDARGRKRFYSALCTPLTEDGKVRNIVISLTDETEKVLLMRVLDRSITSAGDTKNLIEFTLDLLWDTYDLSTAAVFNYEIFRRDIVLQSERGFDMDIVDKIRMQAPGSTPNGIATITVTKGGALLMEDFENYPVVKRYDTDKVMRMRAESMLSLPIAQGGYIYGTLQLTTRKGRRFSVDDIKALDILAGHLATGIHKCMLEGELFTINDQLKLYVDIMSHDINNMNQSATGFLELAKSDPGTPEHVKGILDRALISINSSSRLIEKVSALRNISRKEDSLKKIDLNGLLVGCIQSIASSAMKEVVINYTPRPRVYVIANELLREVFLNIMENSIKYSDKSVTINIGVDCDRSDGIMNYRVIIEDNGPGISDKYKATIFQKFCRGGIDVSGKGLGLYIVRSILELYGGRIKLEDRVPGNWTKGVKFIIYLPAWY